MLCRRSKYVDFIIFACFFLLFVYAYFSRQVLLDRLRRKEIEREKLEHNANSLKEELKIVYYHTAKLEEALKSEQDNHKITNSKLATQSLDFKVNLTNLKRQYADKLKAKDTDIKSYSLENEDLKRKHKLVEEQYAILTKEHKKVAIQVQTDYDKLKKAKEEESLHLQDQIQETYNQKVFFQKKALTYEDDYKKTLKKLVRCKSVLARRNSSAVTRPKVSKRKRKRAVTEIITEVLPTESAIHQKVIHSKVLPVSIMTDLIHPKILPTELANTFNQPNVLPTEEKAFVHVGSKELELDSAITRNELPAKRHGSLPISAAADKGVKNLATDVEGNESKANIPAEELSHEKILSPIIKKMENDDKPLGGVESIKDYT